MTIGEIKKSVIVKILNNKLTDKYDIFLDVHNKVRSDLLDYYATDEGRAEIDDSPHRALTTVEAVDLLMTDVDIWINKDLGLNAEVIE